MNVSKIPEESVLTRTKKVPHMLCLLFISFYSYGPRDEAVRIKQQKPSVLRKVVCVCVCVCMCVCVCAYVRVCIFLPYMAKSHHQHCSRR